MDVSSQRNRIPYRDLGHLELPLLGQEVAAGVARHGVVVTGQAAALFLWVGIRRKDRGRYPDSQVQ